MNSGDPKRTYMNVRLMTFEQLFDTDIEALIEAERQKSKVPFGREPELAEKIRQATDFSEIHEGIARLEEKIDSLRHSDNRNGDQP